jgi:LmbE family N-acetylglucosaminyl deacetylase
MFARALVRTWRRALVLRGHDVTIASEHASCVVLAPHPDDETIGCGATILRKRAAGARVTVVVATDGRYSTRSKLVSPSELARRRASEAIEATEILGVPPEDLLLLGHDDLSLHDSMDTVVDELTRIVAPRLPDEVLVASAKDGHPDHVALNAAARRLRPALPDHCRLLEYPTWYWYEGPPWRPGPTRVHRALRTARGMAASVRAARPDLVATDGYLAGKRRALACYRSQTTGLSHEEEWETLPADFLDCFLGDYELFLPVS